MTERADVFVLLDEYVAAMVAQVGTGEIAAATWETYHTGLDHFIDYARARRELDGDVLRGWLKSLRDQNCKPATINTWLTAVRSFLGWAQAHHYIPYNPAADVRGEKRRGSKKEYKRDRLTDAEMLRVLDQPDASPAGKRDHAYLMLRAYTGVRDIELHRADVAELSTRDGRAVLYVHGKGHAEADELVVLVPDVEQALMDWIAIRTEILRQAKKEAEAIFISLSDRSLGKRLSRRAIRWMVKHYFAAAGVVGDRKTSHSMRHAAISSVLDHGGTLLDAQTLARHENAATTGIYVHQRNRLLNPPEELIRYK